MSQAVKKKIKTMCILVSVLCILSLGAAVLAAYLNTNRDTRMAPEKMTKPHKFSTEGYESLYESDKFEYLYKEKTNVIAIRDKENGYVWKTGLDIPFNTDIDEAHNAVKRNRVDRYAKSKGITPEEVKEIAKLPKEANFNDKFIAEANSIVTVEYYYGEGESMTVTRVSSGSKEKADGTSILEDVPGKKNERALRCKFEIEGGVLSLTVYITFTDDGKIKYRIPNKEIQDDKDGQIKSRIANIKLTPYLGATGGILHYLTKNEYGREKWEKQKIKDITPGYVMVPDGSGALMRFQKNKAEYSSYQGSVYGEDPASAMYYYSQKNDAVELKEPNMPVFGVSHGDGTQAAFVAYATSGDEHMSINVTPSSIAKQSKNRYTYAYPAFNYNAVYFQVKDQAGKKSYRKTQDNMNKFDAEMTYEFLSGDGKDGTPSADYVGMAKAYRNYLIDNKILTKKNTAQGNIPIRIDFLMSDSKKGVFSTQEVPVTTVDNVKTILDDLYKDNVKNINSGLIGWQSGGETIAKPNSTSFSSSIGSESDFEDMMSYFNKKKIDVSYSRDFTTINEDMVSYYKVAATHLSTKYVLVDKSAILPQNVPVTEYGYASPESSAEWLDELFGDVGGDSKSFTIDGISNTLISSHDSSTDETTVSQAIKLYQKSFANIKKNNVKLNMVNPNQYCWKYTDRYLQSPVGTTQYVYETDTVPFLQMVLNGTMEVYAPYSNFSFYSKDDMLKMIDYNISPSFVLTKEPSYLLSATTSADYYSTEYSQYESIINDIYSTVNNTLKNVQGYEWTNRKVLNDGVIANTYKKDNETKTVVINYTKDQVKVKGQTIDKLSAVTLEGGVE